MKEDPRELRERELLARRVERQTAFTERFKKKIPWEDVAEEKERVFGGTPRTAEQRRRLSR